MANMNRRKFQRNQAKKTGIERAPIEVPAIEPSDIPQGFCFIMTCMDRLDHVEKSAAMLLSDPRIDGVHNHFVLVDFYCPKNTGQIMEDRYKDRIHVIRLAEHSPIEAGKRAVFHKPLAHNTGALEALHLQGCQYLVFIDADTLVTKDLLNFVFYHASPDRFLIFEPNNSEKRDLTGFLVVHRRAFTKVNGFDLRFRGWGAEDLELRIKLYLRGRAPIDSSRIILQRPEFGMQWTEIPTLLGSSISHEDDRRTRNYEEQDKDISHSKNLNLLCTNIYEWLGCHPVDLQNTPLSSRIQRLLGMDLIINPKSFE